MIRKVIVYYTKVEKKFNKVSKKIFAKVGLMNEIRN